MLVNQPMANVSTPAPDTIALEGEIDMHESPRVKEKLNPIIDRKPAQVFVDLSGVSYIDSSGLAIFIEALQRVHAYGGKLAIFGIRDNVRAIFEIARLDRVFNIYPDKAAAAAA
jgi:anti-sigma B factor antagonist